ncbi:MAG: hypothetical protein C0391_03895 [Anaerolinea sp.]|nr:hypothetical protein [Anaerolinea sp.]
MKIVLLQDFRGVETRENFYLKGEVVEFENEAASRLIADGRAKAITETPKMQVAEAPKTQAAKVDDGVASRAATSSKSNSKMKDHGKGVPKWTK